MSILLYRCTTWTLTKRMEKKLDGNYTRILRAILNKSWRQQPTKQQLYGHLPHITKTIKIKRTRHAEHCWRSRNVLISDVLLWTPSHGRANTGWPARIYIHMPIRDVALKTCRKQWTISVLMAWHDDNDETFICTVFKSQKEWKQHTTYKHAYNNDTTHHSGYFSQLELIRLGRQLRSTDSIVHINIISFFLFFFLHI